MTVLRRLAQNLMKFDQTPARKILAQCAYVHEVEDIDRDEGDGEFQEEQHRRVYEFCGESFPDRRDAVLVA